VIELNRAVAVAMADGPAAGLALVDAMTERGDLAGSYLLPATRGELLTRLGRPDAAVAALEEALVLCPSASERAALDRKLDRLRAG
jgi:predicted RNA polymerase sigma factor